MVYESIALHRWDQSKVNRQEPYEVLYPNPTVKTTSTAAIVRRDVSRSQAEAARTFVKFLGEPQQQEVFVKYGFRPVSPNVDIEAVANSPWREDIPGIEADPNTTVVESPERGVVEEVVRQWQRSQ